MIDIPGCSERTNFKNFKNYYYSIGDCALSVAAAGCCHVRAAVMGANFWNALPVDIRQNGQFQQFKAVLMKTYLLVHLFNLVCIKFVLM